jgi:squalene synthase HpnC
MTIDEAFIYCENIAKKHYENFPIGLLVPRHIRKHVFSIYAFARFADDIADEGDAELEYRKSQLENWLCQLDECYLGTSKHPIFIALGKTIQEFNIPKSLFADLIKAFIMDVEKNRYDSFDEILFYCKHSANPIGRLMLIFFNKSNSETNLYSDYICSALQIANFLQDVSIDIKKNRIYFPLDSFAKHNYSEQDFFDKKINNSFINIFDEQLDKTYKLFEKGKPLVRHLKGRIKFEMLLTIESGKTILKKSNLIKHNIFFQRPVITTIDKLIILKKTALQWILI